MGKVSESFGDIKEKQNEAKKYVISSMGRAGRGLARTGIAFGIPESVRKSIKPEVWDVALDRLLRSGEVGMKRLKGEEVERVVFYLRKKRAET